MVTPSVFTSASPDIIDNFGHEQPPPTHKGEPCAAANGSGLSQPLLPPAAFPQRLRQPSAVAELGVVTRPRLHDVTASPRSNYTMKRMKAYASFDEYLEAQSPKNQAIIRALRKFVKRIEPKLSEAVKWGNGCWIGSKGPVAYVYSDMGYVQFGFFNGSSLKDPKGLLEGKGQYVRHIKVHDRSAIDERAFAALLRQAAHSG